MSAKEDSRADGLDWLAEAGKPGALTVTVVSPQRAAPEAARSGPTTPAPPGPPLRRLMERYQVLDTLGEGGMGVVYLAVEDNLRRPVALKFARTDDQEALGRFVLEAQVTARLDHPGIVPVYALEVSKDGGIAYSMKRIEGTTLEKALEELAALRAREGESAAVQTRRAVLLESLMRVCEAVSYAHRRQVVHRDLKPANIMLGSFHEVYVVDWGLAKLGPEEPSPRGEGPGPITKPARGLGSTTASTQDGEVRGTPRYMAPEQARGDTDAIGPPADVYALGLILHEVLYLSDPRGGQTLDAVLAEAREGRLAPPPAGASAPAELAAIVGCATRRAPGERYPTAGELAADLRSALRNEETKALPDRGWRRLRRWISRRPQVASASAVALAALLLGGWAASWLRYQTAEAEARLADRVREDALRDLSATASGQARGLAIRLLEHAGHTQAIAAATEAVLELDRPGDRAVHPPSAFASLEDAPPGSAASAHYGGRIISPRALVGTGDPRDVALLGRLYGRLRAPFEAPGKRAEEVDRAILAHEVALEWSYVGLERSGAIVLFPGTKGWGADYDARRRTWYVEAKAAYDARRELQSWTKPYEDTLGQGLVVTCCQVVVGPRGVDGVAAVDISLQRLIGELDAAAGHLPGFRRAVLVDEEGTLLVSTGAGAKVLTPHPDGARLRAATASDGWFRSDRPGLLLAWARLPRLRWTLVVEVDERELLGAHAAPRSS